MNIKWGRERIRNDPDYEMAGHVRKTVSITHRTSMAAYTMATNTTLEQYQRITEASTMTVTCITHSKY
jgi:hypothetical protein